MYKTNLSFLEPIFKKNNHYSSYNILIVNQTDKGRLLISEYENIKVINSFERGSPASRNLAITKSTGDICLMADDDFVYEANFDQKIIDAHKNNPNADFISFEAIDENGELYAKYHNVSVHNKKSLKRIYTCVITFKREPFVRSRTFFNHYFGVGSLFQGVTEYVFLRNAYDNGMSMYHEHKIIVIHLDKSSGRRQGSDNAFFARSAAAYRFMGNLSYLWLLKYTLFTIRHKYIKINDALAKFRIGLNGISKYKDLERSGDIDKIYEY